MIKRVFGMICILILIGILISYIHIIQRHPIENEIINITIVILRRDTHNSFFLGPIKSEKINLSINANTTIGDLKEMIFHRTNFSFTEQKWIWKGKEMKKRKTLEYYNVSSGSKIHVITFDY